MFEAMAVGAEGLAYFNFPFAKRPHEETKHPIKRLLLERLSLSGICRATGVSLRWLLTFIAELYDMLPDDLFVQSPKRTTAHIRVLRLAAEADEMWSFVGRKANKQWNRNGT
jgi:insertion element IS1 protein InsB